MVETTQDLLMSVTHEIGMVHGPTATAELLVALAHQCRDRSVWGGERALTYWDRLPEKIRMATYAGYTLARWWERCSHTLGCTPPRVAEDRVALAVALAGGDDAQVLAVLRSEPHALCLRVRLAHQYRRGQAPLSVHPVSLDQGSST